MAADLLQAGFQGKLIRRGDEGYGPSIYQYASTSYEEQNLIAPDAVIYPTGDNDVKRVIAYAKAHNISVAIRTGGHHYTGASSTSGRNIQLDMSQTYTDFEWQANTRFSVVTVGISTTLSKFMAKLEEAGRFVPTGQCSYVNLGGHVQTGGYGHLIRGFGLLADCVQKIRIINSDAEVQWVQRDDESDKDLFYALLGGSPGNFGVITDVTLQVYRDQDHPKSRGLHGRVPYSRSRLERLLDIMAKMDETDETPADFDYSITVTSGRPVEDRPPGIVVFAQWANLEGKKQEYDSTLFDKIKAAIGDGVPWTPHGGVLYDDQEAPLSTLCSHWVFPIAREFQLPYFKRAYITESRSLDADGWANWAANRLHEILGDPKDNCYVSAQFSYLGGKSSRFRINDPQDEMSFSWRRDSTFACTMDAFYDGEGAPKTKAREWVEKNDAEGVGHPDAKFSKEDRRLLWGSRDTDLHEARSYYYDSTEKYDRLSQIKQTFDPKLVFTANKFAVGPHPARLDQADSQAKVTSLILGF